MAETMTMGEQIDTADEAVHKAFFAWAALDFRLEHGEHTQDLFRRYRSAQWRLDRARQAQYRVYNLYRLGNPSPYPIERSLSAA